MTNPIRLITRADDAGTNPTSNAAILDAYQNGLVKNVSVLAVGPAVEDAASLLAHEKGLCFGLHTALNAELAPQCPVITEKKEPLAGK